MVDPPLLPSLTDIGLTTEELLADGYRQVPLWEHIAVSLARPQRLCGRDYHRHSAGAADGAVGWPRRRVKPVRAVPAPTAQNRPDPAGRGLAGDRRSVQILPDLYRHLLSVVVGASAAVERIGRSRIRVAQTLGASRQQIFLRVVLPDALPDLFTTVRLSIGIGWTSLIAAEMVAASSGLGWMVINASSYLRTDIVMLGILLLGGIGYLLDLLLLGLQRLFVPRAGKE